MKNKTTSRNSWRVFFMTLALGLAVLATACPQAETRKKDVERFRKTANALEARGLYEPAIAELKKYREQAVISKEEEADVLHKMGMMAYDGLDDCDSAVTYLTMAAALNPEASWKISAEKTSIECLEELGYSKQARSLLAQLTGDAGADGKKEGTVVATVGDRQVTWGEVVGAITTRLPREALLDEETRRNLVHDYVFTYAFAQEARAKGMDKSPDIREAIQQTEREVLAGKFIASQIKDPNDEKEMVELGKRIARIHEIRFFDEAIPTP